jgi:hypothetical protein
MSDATIRIIGRGERCCLSIESDAPLPGDDHDSAAERIVHGAADIIVAPIARIAERIGINPVCGDLPDGVYITTPDGRVYDWPAVVDTLVQRIEQQPVDYHKLADCMVDLVLDKKVLGKDEPRDSVVTAVDNLCTVLPGVTRDDVYEAVKRLIVDTAQAVHEDLERGDAEGGGA